MNPFYALNLLFYLNTQLGSLFFSFNFLNPSFQFDYLWFIYNNKYPFLLSPLYLNLFFVKTSETLGFTDFPIFFYFGVFFFLTTAFSFLFFNFLGLYGVFSLNLVSLLSFWLSLVYYFNAIFVDNMLYKIVVGK